MYSIKINEETDKDVDVNFQEGYDFIIDKGIEHNTTFRKLTYYFEEVIDRFIKEYPHLTDCIDPLCDNRYYVSCATEDEANEIESWLCEHMENAESIVNDYIDEYEEELELCVTLEDEEDEDWAM